MNKSEALMKAFYRDKDVQAATEKHIERTPEGHADAIRPIDAKPGFQNAFANALSNPRKENVR